VSRSLRASHEALLQFLYRVPIGLVQATPEGAITTINPMAANLLMPLARHGELSNLFEVLDGALPTLRALVAERGGAAGDVVCDGLRFAAPEGRTLSLQLLRLDAGTLMASVGDVTLQVAQERERLESRLRDAARTDGLTRLPTRVVVRERLEGALPDDGRGGAAHLGLLHVNVDRFARFNLLLGQDGGDALLCRIAERLAGAVRAHDRVEGAAASRSTAARLGADEFVVLLEHLRDPQDATRVAQRLVDVLCRPYEVAGQPVHATVSIGVAVASRDAAGSAAERADALLQDAGLGMREAKGAGGGRWRLFEPAMKSSARRRGSIEADLRLALQRDELFVVYQPIVRLGPAGAATARAEGVEALVRWRHPRLGLVGPADFIEVAEQTGLIVPLGEQVLDAACAQWARWRDTLGDAAPRLLSVNLSRAQLDDSARIVERVGRALRGHDVPPAALQLEVTESLAAHDARDTLAALAGLGVRLALDDFGTGYSSLSSLHALPVHVVKIDRSFVERVESSEHHRALIRATVLVARSLGLRTVAEGVETDGQARVLASLDCERAQGFVFARPMPAEETTRWLLRRAGADEPPRPRAASA
jgi:diguanylate cyclase (GGDEF)-like protein